MLYDFHCVNYIWSWESPINTYPLTAYLYLIFFTSPRMQFVLLQYCEYFTMLYIFPFNLYGHVCWHCYLDTIFIVSWCFFQNFYGRRKTRSQQQLRQDSHDTLQGRKQIGTWSQECRGRELEEQSSRNEPWAPILPWAQSRDTTVPPTEGSETLP